MWLRRFSIALAAIVGATAMVRFGSAAWCARDAAAWRRGDGERQLALARTVAGRLSPEAGAPSFSTGSARFDGEWLFGTHVMAALGLAQTALAHPAESGELRPALERALDGALSKPARGFDRLAWGADPLETLDGDAAHAAYLGYLGIALGLARRLEPAGRHAPLHDRIAEALTRRLERTETLLLETYPGERYPVDNASVVATIALHARATGGPEPAVVARWTAACRERFVDRDTGLLIQSVAADGVTALDRPRGSGTALAVYFLSFADPKLSRDLFVALERELAGTVLGFGVVREYPRGVFGLGDIDSGPLVAGYSISAMGFSLAGCRMHGDAECFDRRYAGFHLLGAPFEHSGRWSFVSGGALGDAILLAMLTARPPEAA